MKNRRIILTFVALMLAILMSICMYSCQKAESPVQNPVKPQSSETELGSGSDVGTSPNSSSGDNSTQSTELNTTAPNGTSTDEGSSADTTKPEETTPDDTTNSNTTPPDTTKPSTTKPSTTTKPQTTQGTHVHTVVTDKAVAPTCMNTGLTEGSHCSSCGKVIKKQDVVPTVDHKWGPYVVTQEKTCTEPEYSCAMCEYGCGSAIVMNSKEPGHELGDWETVAQYTCSKEGKIERKCTKCTYKEDKTVIGEHDLTDWVIVKPAGCQQNEVKERHCKNCSYKREVTTGNAGCDIGEWTLKTSQNCTSGEIQHTFCKRCNHEFTRVVSLKKDHTYGSWKVKYTATSNTDLVEERSCTGCGKTQLRVVGSKANAITARPGNNLYGYSGLALNKNGLGMQKIYYNLYTICETFMTSTADVSKTGEEYVIGEFDFGTYGISVEEAVSAWKIFTLENPRYYWMSNTCSILGTEMSVLIDGTYASASYRKECDDAITKMENECTAALKGKITEVEKHKAIHDFVIANLKYAYESDGVTPEKEIWAHNIIGCAVKKNGVCESYAKTYMYLCLKNGLNCIMVTGDGNGEDHAWNMIEIDGRWYGVDCTWDETDKKIPMYVNFGMSKSATEALHTADTPDTYGAPYLYELPELHGAYIQMIYLYKNGTYLGLMTDIDAAFAAMTDSSANYEIKLFNYSEGGHSMPGMSQIAYISYAKTTPKVKSLKISGYAEENGDVSYTENVFFYSNIEIGSNITFYNISPSFADVDMKAYTLTFDDAPYISFFDLVGSKGSKIKVNYVYGIEPQISGNINIDKIELDSATLFLGPVLKINSVYGKGTMHLFNILIEDVYIKEAKLDELRFNDCIAPKVHIGKLSKFSSDKEHVMIMLQSTAVGFLPDFTVDSVDSKIFMSFSCSGMSIRTDMSGNEIGRGHSNDALKKNSVIIKSKDLDYSDFYCLYLQDDIFDSNSDIIGNRSIEEYDASKVLRRETDGSFTFIGWATPVGVYYNS